MHQNLRYMRASYSSFVGKDQFVMEFGEKTLKQRLKHTKTI